MSAFSDAYSEVARMVQPDVEPTLTHGAGSTADPTKELDAIILASVRGVTWTTATTLTFGQIVFPATRMGRRYRVITGGVTGATEPTWPDYDYATLTDGTVTLVEEGSDFSSVYDIRKAVYDAWNLKAAKATAKDQYLQDSRGQASTYLYLNCIRERDRYVPVGIA